MSGSYCHITNHPKLSGFKQHSFIIPHEFTAKPAVGLISAGATHASAVRSAGGSTAGRGLDDGSSSAYLLFPHSRGMFSWRRQWSRRELVSQSCPLEYLQGFQALLTLHWLVHPTRQSKSCAQAQCQRGRDKKVGAKGVDTDREAFNREHC